MSNSSNTFLGLLAGTAIGATLGILFAPDRGSVTRQRIADEAAMAKENLGTKANELRDIVSERVSTNKETLDQKVDAIVTNASYKADDIINSLERRLKDLKARNKKYQKSKASNNTVIQDA